MVRTLVLDANVLVLLTVGLANPKYIARHKRLHPTYCVRHFDLLLDLVRQAPAAATTTHALTEASNLIRQCAEPMRSDVMLVLQELIQTCDELTPSARQASELPEFFRLGLTDAAFISLDPEKHTFLSADLDLVIALQNRGVDAINFFHLAFE